jgi:seryl-tRNA synthetase
LKETPLGTKIRLVLDPKFIVQNRAAVEEAVRNKNEKRADIARICELDERRKKVQYQDDELKRRLNEASEAIGRSKGKDPQAIEKARLIKEEIAALAPQRREIQEAIEEAALWVPNLPASDVPVGPDSSANRVVRVEGRAPEFAFKPREHVELVDKLGLVDFGRGSKIAGSHWLLFRDRGALLERAMINFMLDVHTREHGYTEVSPPFLVNRESMIGTGQIPKLENDMYRLRDDDLFLIPTAEVPVTNIYRNEQLDGRLLPLKLCAYSACFRRESGAYGAETRGMVRIHQFDKVELVKFVHPAGSFEELEKLLGDAEEILRRLGLHYRVVLLSTGDMSFASAKTYDIELWAPGQNRWLEASSCSNFTDFQARRAGIQFRDADGKLKFVHTLNGSGVAMPRTFIAILEQFQQADGSVRIPEPLRPYMNGMEMLK